MRFETGGRDSHYQTLIMPLFKDSLPDESKLPEMMGNTKLLPYMGARQATTWIYGNNNQPDILLIGLGEAAKFQSCLIREAAGCAGRALEKEQRLTAAVTFDSLYPSGSYSGLQPEDIAAWVEGMLLGTYTFDKYTMKAKELAKGTICFIGEANTGWEEAIRLGQVRANSTIWARELANEPPNRLRPQTLAERVKERFVATKAQVTIYEAAELEAGGFAGTAAVGRGSAHSPLFIDIRYCTDESKPLTALIGKGVTFDTGGISLKRDHDISDMRMDMAGAAAVLGALDLIVHSGAAANVAVLVPVAENAVSGGALLPGEIIRYASGLTVQVGNTDSEGRLILADALLHARRIGAATAIDLATLTYAVVGALGSRMAGILGDDGLALELRAAGEPFDERLWQLPLVEEYESYLDSDYADTNNISHVGEAGAITAALFLRKFVHPELKWAHIDMSGVKAVSSANGEKAVGATGYGVRMLARHVTGC